jgi:hypothetical protein
VELRALRSRDDWRNPFNPIEMKVAMPSKGKRTLYRARVPRIEKTEASNLMRLQLITTIASGPCSHSSIRVLMLVTIWRTVCWFMVRKILSLAKRAS